MAMCCGRGCEPLARAVLEGRKVQRPIRAVGLLAVALAWIPAGWAEGRVTGCQPEELEAALAGREVEP